MLDRFLTLLFASALIVGAWGSCDARFVETSFGHPGLTREYRARVSADPIDFNLSQQLELAERSKQQEYWLITARMTLQGLMCPSKVKYLSLPVEGSAIPGILVIGRGATRNWVYVVEVKASNASYSATLHLLFESYFDGSVTSVRLLTDQKKRVKALVLQFAATHVVSDDEFSGHIILSRTYTWSPAKQSFSTGPFRVDVEAEKRLDWLQAITYLGSDRLGVFYRYDDRTSNSTRWFRPSGILRDKLPRALRSAPVIEVVTNPSGKILRAKPVKAMPE